MSEDTLYLRSTEKLTSEKTSSEPSSKTGDYSDHTTFDAMLRSLEEDSLRLARTFYKTRFEHLSNSAKTTVVWFFGAGVVYCLLAIVQLSIKDYVMGAMWAAVGFFSFLAAGCEHGHYLELKEKLARIYADEIS